MIDIKIYPHPRNNRNNYENRVCKFYIILLFFGKHLFLQLIINNIFFIKIYYFQKFIYINYNELT